MDQKLGGIPAVIICGTHKKSKPLLIRYIIQLFIFWLNKSTYLYLHATKEKNMLTAWKDLKVGKSDFSFVSLSTKTQLKHCHCMY